MGQVRFRRDVNTAIAGGSIDIGLVGSSPLAVAASNKLPIETFLIADLIGDAEALVVRNGAGIDKPRTSSARPSPCPSSRRPTTACSRR